MLKTRRTLWAELQYVYALEMKRKTGIRFTDGGNKELEAFSAVPQRSVYCFAEHLSRKDNSGELLGSDVNGEEESRDVMSLCTQWWLQSLLKKSMYDKCNNKESAAYDEFLVMLGYNLVLSQSRRVRKRRRSGRGNTLRKLKCICCTKSVTVRRAICFWWCTCKDEKWLNVGSVERMCSWVEWCRKDQRLEREEVGSDKYVEVFWNQMTIQVVSKFSWFNLRGESQYSGWLPVMQRLWLCWGAWLSRPGLGQQKKLSAIVQGKTLELHWCSWLRTLGCLCSTWPGQVDEMSSVVWCFPWRFGQRWRRISVWTGCSLGNLCLVLWDRFGTAIMIH